MIVNLGSVQLLGNLDRLGIAIERNEPSLRGQLFKNATRMTSAPECSVDVQSVRVSHKRLRRLLAQNRQMNECLAHARNSQTMEAEPTAPPRKFFTIRTRSPPHQARPRAPRVHAPQACFCPQLEVLAHADQRNLPVEAAHLPEFGGNQNPACTVRLQIDGAAENIAHEGARRIRQLRQRPALLLPDGRRIQHQTTVGMPRHRDFSRARNGKSLPMPCRHRQASLLIQ